MEEKKQGKPNFPPLNLPEDLKPQYSNISRISHTPSEIVMDFATLFPGTKPEVVARVLMSPVGAKMFWRALGENLTRYEANFGTINLPGGGSSDLAQTLFRNINPNNPPETPEDEE